MSDQKLKQFERSLKDKIDELQNVSKEIDKNHFEKYKSHSFTALACENKADVYKETLNMLYEVYPELKLS